MYEETTAQCGAGPIPAKQVGVQIQRLDSLASELQEVITTLDKRVSPISRPCGSPVVCEAVPHPEEILVELAMDLKEKCDRVESAIHRIQTITNLLEL